MNSSNAKIVGRLCLEEVDTDYMRIYKDINGQYIYTGDVINNDKPDGFQNTLALTTSRDID